MDEFQERLATVGLATLAEYGFVLAGGFALQAHGLVDRKSEDVDLFTDRWDARDFARAVQAACDAYERSGLDVAVVRRAETFARLHVSDSTTGQVGSVDVAADFRERQPVRLTIGPVLAEWDAVAAKTAAVFSRGEARDYLDLAGILASGRYDRETLMALAAQADGGFDRDVFRHALAAVDRFPDEEFALYGLGLAEIAEMRELMRDWSRDLEQQAIDHPGGATSAPEVQRRSELVEDADKPRNRNREEDTRFPTATAPVTPGGPASRS